MKEIGYKFNRLFKILVKRPAHRVSLIVAWIYNVLWKDEDWDHHYFLEIIKYKLKRMKKCFDSSTVHEIDIKGIRICIKLIDRIQNDFYQTRATKRHEAKWGPAITEFKDTGDGWYTLDTTVPKATTPELKQLERLEYEEAWKRTIELEAKQLPLLFGIMSKHLLHWWD